MVAGEELFGSVYEKGSVIFRQGESGDTMYIIQSGAVEVSHGQGDQEVVLALLEKGDFFGEMALLHQDLRSATVTTIRQTRLLPMTCTLLLERVRQDPGVALHILKGLALRIQRTEQKIRQAAEEVEENESSPGSAPNREDLKTIPSASPHAKSPPPEASFVEGDEHLSGEISIDQIADLWQVSENTAWYEEAETIFKEGDAGDAMYIIVEGLVDIGRGSRRNRSRLAQLGPGDFFGEMAILTDSLRNTTATTATRTRLMSIKRDEFSRRIMSKPELALYLIQSLIAHLRRSNAILINPKVLPESMRRSWKQLLKKEKPVRLSIVSLSTCAGCSAVLLDDRLLAEVMERANIIYCPMLTDQDKIGKADVTLIDGVVRLKEDEEKLEEARAKSRFLIAWGTCAAFGGIPAKANQFELEDIIEETYGQADDAFAYYLSGKRGVDHAMTYQRKGVSLLRKAYRLSDFSKVDYYLPGCPPRPGLLLQLMGELTGRPYKEAPPIICNDCDRKPSKSPVTSPRPFPPFRSDPMCFNSQGTVCLGFLTRGGCEAACPQHGLPCWGCRGPSKAAMKKVSEGDSFEEVVVANLAKRWKMQENQVKQFVKLFRKQTHGLFRFDKDFHASLSRVR